MIFQFRHLFSRPATRRNQRRHSARYAESALIHSELLENRLLLSAAPVAQAQFDIESNNTQSRANFIGSFGGGSHDFTRTGRTGTGSDSADWYKFAVSGTTSGSITLSGLRQDLDIELYRGTTLIGSSRRSGTSTDTITLNNLSAGEYHIRIYRGTSTAQSNYSLRMRMNVSSVERESNDTPTLADSLGSYGAGTHSRTFNGHAGSGTDSEDWFTFTVTATTNGSIRLRNLTQDLDIQLYRDRGRTIIGSSIRSGTSDDTITLNNLSSGEYHIRVFRGESGASSRYSLDLNLTVGGTGQRDLSATSVSVRETSAAYGSTVNITATVRNAGTATVSSFQVGFTFNTLRGVRGPTMDDLKTITRTIRPGESHTFTVAVRLVRADGGLREQGLRYIGMTIVAENRDPTSNNRAETRTRINVTPPIVEPRVDIRHEPNNTRSQAGLLWTFPRSSFQQSKNFFGGHTGLGADTQDWFKFRVEGTASGTIGIHNMIQDLDIELYNSSGTRIDISDESGTASDVITVSNLAAGDYFVQVIPGVSGARSNYDLRFGLTVR